ncbi:hypothetical protein GQ44DRAFT_770464 [Phaeosphaeriaceae sp. PMI808]|nr:hypothetical protein GQ44DRAFT_770464 [Phaeosphaeriaceae sp. PMI808]
MSCRVAIITVIDGCHIRNEGLDVLMIIIYRPRSLEEDRRVILNESHNALYGSSSRKSFDASNLREVVKYARCHVDVLESWRKLLPLDLAWNDDDPPATDLNIARLRTKYYGGLYMILRPYLRIAIHAFKPLSQQNSLAATADLAEDQRQVIEIACQCIDAAIWSTIAFGRVGADPDSSYEEFQSTRTERLVS